VLRLTESNACIVMFVLQASEYGPTESAKLQMTVFLDERYKIYNVTENVILKIKTIIGIQLRTYQQLIIAC